MADNEKPDTPHPADTGEIATAESNNVATTTAAAPNKNRSGMSVWFKAFIWVLVVVVDVLILWYLAEDFSNMIGQEKDQAKTPLTALVQKEEESKVVPESGSDPQEIVSDVGQKISSSPASLFRSIDEAVTADVAPQIIQSAVDSSPSSLLVEEGLNIRERIRDAQSAAIPDSVESGMKESASETVKPVEQEKGLSSGVPRERYYGFWQRPGFQRQPTYPRAQTYNNRAVDERARQARIQRRTQPNYYPRAPWGYPNPPVPYSGYGGYQPYPFNRAP